MRAALDSQNPKSALTELILARAAQSRVLYGVLTRCDTSVTIRGSRFGGRDLLYVGFLQGLSTRI